MTKSAQLSRHIHFWVPVYGTTTIGKRRVSKYKVCRRCKAKKA